MQLSQVELSTLQYADVATHIKVALKPKPNPIVFNDPALDAALERQSMLQMLQLEHDLGEAYTKIEELAALNATLHAKIRAISEDKEHQLAEAAARMAALESSFDGLSGQMEEKLAKAIAKVNEMATANAQLTQKVRVCPVHSNLLWHNLLTPSLTFVTWACLDRGRIVLQHDVQQIKLILNVGALCCFVILCWHAAARDLVCLQSSQITGSLCSCIVLLWHPLLCLHNHQAAQ